MKILMLTPYLPYPPASGGQIRTLNLLKYLSKNHDITLVSLYKNEAEKNYASRLETYCNRIFVCKRAEKPWQLSLILRSVFSALPFLIVRNYSSEAHTVISRLLNEEKFDVIHAETFYIMPHIPPTNVPTLLVEQTIEFKVYQHFVSALILPVRWALSLDILKLKFWEIFYWKKANLVATVSQADRQIIESHVPGNDTYVIPNGAGDEMFVKTLPAKKPGPPVLLFVGNFFWLQNTEAAEYLRERIFPKIREQFPGATLIIAGQNVHSKLQPGTNDGVKIVDLPADNAEVIKEMYRKATIFIAPIFGPGGTRLKILAAMASGLPVVSTKTGIEGLEAENGTHFLIAKEPDEFVEQVGKLARDHQLSEKLRKNAFALVTKNYSWSRIAKKLENLYEVSTRITRPKP
ncbi:MAG: glycosyltransferase family 4 protein [Patescibacteria group bacterium]|nr:glycosyltransferase family 4 protein [Patescibacteria group bacterium]